MSIFKFCFILLSTPAVHICSVHGYYNITALSSRGGYSVLECWTLAAEPVDAFSAINYGLGQTEEAFWSVIKPRTTVGEAWAPAVQLTMILTGMVRITAPAPESSLFLETRNPTASCHNVTSPPETRVAYIMPGTSESSVLIAADMKSLSHIRGHYTDFASDELTILVQVRFEGNVAPEHTILHEGPCT